MQAVDVTGLTPQEEKNLLSNPTTSGSVGPDGVIYPTVAPKIKDPNSIDIKKNKKNLAILAKYGERVFNKSGKVVRSRFPIEKNLSDLQRRKGDSRENLMSQLGVEYMKKLYLSNEIDKSEMKLATKKELNKAVARFCGLSLKKSAAEKAKDRAIKKSKKEKSGRKHKEKKSEEPFPIPSDK